MTAPSLALYWPTIKRLIETPPKSVLELDFGDAMLGMAIRNYVEEAAFARNPRDPDTWAVQLHGVDGDLERQTEQAKRDYNELFAIDPLGFFESETTELRWLVGARWDAIVALDLLGARTVVDAGALLDHCVRRANKYVLVACPLRENTMDIFTGRNVTQALHLDGSVLVELAGRDLSPVPEPPKVGEFSVREVTEEAVNEA